MGVFQDLLDNAKTFNSNAPVARYLKSLIARQLDPAIDSDFSAKDAVHTVAQSTQTSGNFTLTVALRLYASGIQETFTTGNIAFNAAAATIESAIDTAATAASITGWTNGDISVAGGAVNAAAWTLTFDGTSVDELCHDVSVITDVDGAGGAWGAVTRTTPGQSLRRAFAVLNALGVLDDGTIPPQSADAYNTAVAIMNADKYGKFPQNVLRALVREMAEEDANNNTYHSVIETLSIDDKARLAEFLGKSSIV